MNRIYQGDCLEVMKALPENSVDSIVTDPPYELGFMGKKWDNSGIAYSVPMWKECLRVLKPGGHLLSFSGTRTYHRMAVAIEDAGFEVRDMIEWVYGSGFPKSLNISKAIEKMNGVQPLEKIANDGGRFYGKEGSDYNLTPNKLIMPETQTEDGKKWEGWGPALKPAHEPICLARKPLEEKTVAKNVLKYRTGGINIDESRVEYQGELDKASATPRQIGRFPANLIHDNSEEVRECFPESKGALAPVKSGQKGFGGVIYGKYKEGGDDGATFYGDQSGNSSRFFKSIIYQAKASKSERNKGCEGLEEKEGIRTNAPRENEDKKTPTRTNNHPTVKPIALMEYLIKMITPKGGVVLEPFAGSGSTLVAAKENDFNFIGIELTEDYIPIIEARTGCKIVKLTDKLPDYKPSKFKEEKIEPLQEKINKIQQDICECGGKIKKTASGRCCEWCMKDY